MKQNYEILKDHEVALVKDFEGKKTREVSFYEQRIQEMHGFLNDERNKCKSLEEQHFLLKEQLTKLQLIIEKKENDLSK